MDSWETFDPTTIVVNDGSTVAASAVAASTVSPQPTHQVISVSPKPKKGVQQSKKKGVKILSRNPNNLHVAAVLSGEAPVTHGLTCEVEHPSAYVLKGYGLDAGLNFEIRAVGEPRESDVRNAVENCRKIGWEGAIITKDGTFYYCSEHTTFVKAKAPKTAGGDNCTLCRVQAGTDLETPQSYIHGASTFILRCTRKHQTVCDVGHTAHCMQCRIESMIQRYGTYQVAVEGVIADVSDAVRVECRGCGLHYYTSMESVMNENATGRGKFKKGLYSCNDGHIPLISQVTLPVKIAYYMEKVFGMRFNECPFELSTGALDRQLKYCSQRGLAYKLVQNEDEQKADQRRYDPTNIIVMHFRLVTRMTDADIQEQLCSEIKSRGLGRYINYDPSAAIAYVRDRTKDLYRLDEGVA